MLGATRACLFACCARQAPRMEKRRAWGEDQQAPFTPPGTRRLTSGVFVRRQSPPHSPLLHVYLYLYLYLHLYPAKRGAMRDSNPRTPGASPSRPSDYGTTRPRQSASRGVEPRNPGPLAYWRNGPNSSARPLSPMAPSRSALRRTEGLGGGTRPARGPRAALRAVRTVVFNASAGGLAVFRLRVYVCRSRANAVPRRGRRLAGLPDPKP